MTTKTRFTLNNPSSHMKNNMFENACFGKAYETRDGRKVIFINSNLNNYYLRDESDYCIEVCGDGRAHYNDKDIDSEDDIISEWQEHVYGVELDKLAIEAYSEEYTEIPYCNMVDSIALRSAFKIGYKKALEIN